MANLLDYLDWRGDIPFSVSPFNEIDGLLLSEFGYMPLEGIVPQGFSLRVGIRTAWEQFRSEQVDEKRRILTFEQDTALFEKLAEKGYKPEIAGMCSEEPLESVRDYIRLVKEEKMRPFVQTSDGAYMPLVQGNRTI